MQIGALDPELLAGGRQESRRASWRKRTDIRDLDDGLPLPGIDWKIEVDKAEAAKYGASVRHGRHRRAARHQRREGHRISAGRKRQGRSISWCASRTTGAASTRSTNCACRRRCRPRADRQFRRSASPAPRVGYINRVAGNRVMTVSANVAEGVQSAKVQQEIAAELAKTDLGPGVTCR